MSFLSILILSLNTLWAQPSVSPFELERFSEAQYASTISQLKLDFESEQEALTYYYTAYKLQRSQMPSNYFVAPNEKRKAASNYLHSHFDGGPGVAFVTFLESEASLSACADLLSHKGSYPELLPYQYMAAFLLNQSEKSSDLLGEMDNAGMISEINKAFGENAINSAAPEETILTQGMQDLIAVNFELKKRSEKRQVLNFFAENTKAYSGPRITATLEGTDPLIWVSPTVSGTFYKEHIAELWTAGIGMRYAKGPNPLPQEEYAHLRYVGANFAGLKAKSLNPADLGLVHSYREFANNFTVVSQAENSSTLNKQAKRIRALAGL